MATNEDLRAVAERLLQDQHDACDHIWNAHRQCQWCHRMQRDVDADILASACLREHPAEQLQATQPAQGETVRVRAAVAVGLNDVGDVCWGVSGADMVSEQSVITEACSWIESKPKHVAWIEADIPLPSIPTIPASVETTPCHD